MRWIDDGTEMKFFSMERDVAYDIRDGSVKYRELKLYNIRTGNIFCRIQIGDRYEYRTHYKIQTVPHFEGIEEELYKLVMRDVHEGEPYSYDRYILPLFREKKLKELGI